MDDGNLTFKKLSFIDTVSMNEIGGTANLTRDEFFTIENQKEIFFMGGTVLTRDIEMEVTEAGGVNNTRFSVMVVPDNGRSDILQLMGLVRKTNSTVFAPPCDGVL